VLAGTGYLRGRQDTLTPLAVALGSNVVNLALELLFIPVLGYGIGASALGTVIAQTGAALVYVVRVVGPVRRLDVAVTPDPPVIGRLARTGGPLLVRTAALRGALLGAIAIAAGMGAVEVAAYSIAYETWNFLALALDAIAIAAQAIVGKDLGAGDDTGARAIARRMLWFGLLTGALVGALVLATRLVLPHVFSNDDQVVALSSFALLFVAAFQPMNGVVFVLDGILIGAGDLRYMAGAMVAAAVVFAAGGAAVVWFDLGIGWLWTVIGLFMFTRLATLGVRFRSGNWAIVGATVPKSHP
jgi:putative MATE family efflux protein